MQPTNHAHTSPHADHSELTATLIELGHAFGQFATLEALASLNWELPINAPVLADQLREIIELMRDHKRPSLKLDVLSIAAGFSSESYADVGRRHGIEREAVRQQVDRFRKALKLPPCNRMLSDTEKVPYARNGRRKIAAGPPRGVAMRVSKPMAVK